MSSKKELPISWVNKFGDRIDESDKFEYELTSYLFIPSKGRYELKKSKFITSEREIQASNAFAPIVVTDGGILSDVRL